MSVLWWVRILGVVVIASFALSGWTLVRVARAEATQAANAQASNVAQVSRCYRQLESNPDLLRVLGLIETLATNSITTSKAVLKIRDPKDPLNEVSRQSIARLEPGVESVARFIEQTEAAGPSEQECAHLADSLNVDPKEIR